MRSRRSIQSRLIRLLHQGGAGVLIASQHAQPRAGSAARGGRRHFFCAASSPVCVRDGSVALCVVLLINEHASSGAVVFLRRLRHSAATDLHQGSIVQHARPRTGSARGGRCLPSLRYALHGGSVALCTSSRSDCVTARSTADWLRSARRSMSPSLRCVCTALIINDHSFSGDYRVGAAVGVRVARRRACFGLWRCRVC